MAENKFSATMEAMFNSMNSFISSKTVVGEPITSLEKQARCKKIAEGLGARLRVRPCEQKTGSPE